MKRKRVEIRLIGERIKYLRMGKNLTQKEFAVEMDVSLDAIKDWEQGFHYPGIDTLDKISKFFNCDLDYLFGRRSEPNIVLDHASVYTGLSIEAVDWLHNQIPKEDFTNLLSILNDLILNPDLLIALQDAIITTPGLAWFSVPNGTMRLSRELLKKSELMLVYDKLVEFIDQETIKHD